MIEDSDEGFDSLKRLLAWKGHEQPPPGYFRHFSSSVLTGIRADKNLRSASWWNVFLAQFDFKPLLVSASGLAVCVLLFLGINFAVTDEPSLAFPSVQAEPYTVGNPFSAVQPLPLTMGFSSIGTSLSTTPVTAGDHTAFPFAQPARFTPASIPRSSSWR